MRIARFTLHAIAASLLLAARLAAAITWTVPGAVNASGLNGTKFVSDVTLTNPGTAAAQVTVDFFPSSTPNPKTVTLSPGQTIVHRNIVDSLFGTSGAGALSISSDQPLLIRAKTYNTAASGTYGVALPVLSSDRLLGAGDVADSLWITQDASGSSGFRTNVAVVFPDAEGGEAAVTVFDADGNERGHQDFSRDTPGLQQFAVGSFAGAVSVGRAQVQVIRGRAAGYSVVVDNVTGDSSLFAFEQLPAGWQDVLVNGVARANGRNSTFFRTDGRFYNPTSEDARVTVAFHAAQNDNSSPVTKDFTIPAGKILDVVDVLDSLLGLPVGSSGALRFHSERPVAILCRTSNVDPSGAKPGTFGAQQKPTPLLSFLMSGDEGAVVTGIRQNATFRTNVGFAAGADGAAYTLTLKSAGGATAATASGSLGVFGWTQPNVQDLFPGVTIPDDATLQVKATSGSVDVYDSSIDNASGDPVVTPIAPLPASIPSSATIGPQGGSIRSDDGVLTLRIPAGALGAPTPISIATGSNDAPGALGAAYDLSPGGLALAKPALLCLRYGTAGLPVKGIDGVSLAVLGSTGWGGLTGGRIDTISRSLLIPLQNTSPSSALAGMRNAQAGSETSKVAALKGYEVTGQEFVPTGGKMTRAVVFRAPPTSTGGGAPPFPVGEQSGTSVTWSKPNLGTISSFNNTTTTYTAPSSLKGVIEIIYLRVKVCINTTGACTEFPDSFFVIRRRFLYSVNFLVDHACPNVNDVSLKYSDLGVETTYTLADDMTLAASPGGPGGPPIRSAVAFNHCKSNCTATAKGAPGTPEMQGMAGTFLGAHGFFLAGIVSVTPLVPAWTQDCVKDDGSHTIQNNDPVNYSSGGLPPSSSGGDWPLSNQLQISFPLPLSVTIRATWQSLP